MSPDFAFDINNELLEKQMQKLNQPDKAVAKAYSYTYSSLGSEKINLFESCMQADNIQTQIKNL